MDVFGRGKETIFSIAQGDDVAAMQLKRLWERS